MRQTEGNLAFYAVLTGLVTLIFMMLALVIFDGNGNGVGLSAFGEHDTTTTSTTATSSTTALTTTTTTTATTTKKPAQTTTEIHYQFAKNLITTTTVQTTTSAPPPKPPKDNEQGRWFLRLVNQNFSLSADFAPGNLAYVGGYPVDSRIEADLVAMINTAQAEGIYLVIVSAYRDYYLQAQLFSDQVASQRPYYDTEEEAEAAAATVVARPGTSEHQTGLAIDFNSLAVPFDQSAEYRWLREHGAEYGFIERYFDGSMPITGVVYEPWHWRYVTPEHAAAIKAQGCTLEEYAG